MFLILLCLDVEQNPGPASELSVFNWNVRSIRNKLDTLADLAVDYNILCLTETHLDDNICTNDLLLDYFSEPYRKDRNFAGGGILVYCSESLFCQRRVDLESDEFETIWIEIKLGNLNILLCALYRPPNSCDLFWNYLEYAIDKAYETTHNLVITGDINVNLLANRSRHPLYDIINQFNLVNTIKEPTRIGHTSNTLLDPIFISQSLTFSNSFVIDIDRQISDHNACVSYIYVTLNLNACYKRDVWLYKKGDYAKFNNLIADFDWESVFSNCHSIDEACDIFTAEYISMAKTCIPTRTVTIRPSDKPWMTSELRKEIKLRDKLHNKYKKNKCSTNSEIFKRQRNKVNNMKKYARLSFYENINGVIDKLYTGDPKSYWKFINRITKQSGTTSVVPPLLDNIRNTVVSDDQGKANLLNEYFCSISKVDDSGIETPYFEPRTASTFNALQITHLEVSDILKNLKLGKASGCDLISHQMLKYTSDTVSKPLCTLFNLSLQSKVFPSLWKKAIVIPLFKKGDRHEISNYRPVSLISCIGKVFERIVFKHMYNFLIDNNLFYNLQSGFLPTHTTVYQLIEMYEDICDALEKRKHVCLVFCDISKAFDRVWHRGLIKKLECYGFQGAFLDWLTNYLSNRNQNVLINNNKSNIGEIKAGVPQGSVLGPLLFLLYINDIADGLESIARLFADDTSLSYSSANLQNIEDTINRDLTKLNDWSKTWLTIFNPNKTELLFISTTSNSDNISFSFDGIHLNPVDSHRHLGVTLTNDAKWSAHITAIYQSCMKKVNVMRKFKYILNKNTLLRIYKCFILPVLEYACELWDGCSDQDKHRLESIQLEAARIACGLPVYCKKELVYNESNLELLQKRRERRKLILFYKMHNNLTPPFFQSLLPPLVGDISHYPLRNSNNYTLPNHRLSLSDRSFVPSTVKLWNSLERDKQNCRTLASFKSSLVPVGYLEPPFKSFSGVRKLNILHTRLRNNCSILKYDLFRCNLENNPGCSCGHPCENAFHFFFECPLYQHTRAEFYNDMVRHGNITLDHILYGNPSISHDDNIAFFKAVHRYIRDSRRF